MLRRQWLIEKGQGMQQGLNGLSCVQREILVLLAQLTSLLINGQWKVGVSGMGQFEQVP
jgi:hypothetical protein